MAPSLSQSPVRQKSTPRTEPERKTAQGAHASSGADLGLDDVAASWGNAAAVDMTQGPGREPAGRTDEHESSAGMDLAFDEEASLDGELSTSPGPRASGPAAASEPSDPSASGPGEEKREPVPEFAAAVAAESAARKANAEGDPLAGASEVPDAEGEGMQLDMPASSPPDIDPGGEASAAPEGAAPSIGGGAPQLAAPPPAGLSQEPMPVVALAPTGPLSGPEACSEHLSSSLAHVDAARANGETLKAEVSAAVQGARAELEAEAAGQKATILATVQEKIGGLQGGVEQARGRIEAETGTMASSLSAAAAQARGEIAQARDGEIQRLASEIDAETLRFDTDGKKLATEARDQGKVLADQATKRSQEQAASAQKKADAKIRTFSSKDDPDKLKAMTQAVQTVAADAATQALDAGGKIAQMALQESEKVALGVEQKAAELAKSLVVDVPKVQAEIEKLATQALDQVDAVESSALSGLASGKAAAHAQLDQILEAGVARYEQMGVAATAMVDQAVADAMASLDAVVTDWHVQVDASVDGFASIVASMPDPDPTSAALAASALGSELSGAAQGIIAGVAQGASSVRASIAGGAASLVEDLALSQEAADAGLSGAADQILAALWQSTNEGCAGLSGIGTDVRGGAEGLVNDAVSSIGGAVDKALTELLSKRDEGMKGISSKVDEGLAETDKKLGELPSKMNAAAADVASQYDGPWYSRVGNFLLGALKAIAIVAAVLVVAAVIAVIAIALGVSAAVLATIAAVLVVVALVVVAVVGIYSRWQEYRAIQGMDPDFWTGLGIVVVGILDITGIPSMIEGISGKKAFSGKELTDFERGETFTNGLLSLISTILLVREVTAARDVVKVVNAGETLANVSDDAARLAGSGDDIAKVGGSGDDIAKVGGSGDDIAKVGGSGDDIAQLASKWNDPKLTPDELWQVYKGNTKKPSLSYDDVLARFADGWRFNPTTKRWCKPPGVGGVPTVADDVANVSDDLGKVGDDVANVADDVAKVADDVAALKSVADDVVSAVQKELPAIEQVVAGNAEAVKEVSALRKALDAVADSVKFTSDLKKAEVKAVMDLCAKALKSVERLQVLAADAKGWADIAKSVAKIGDKCKSLWSQAEKTYKAYGNQQKGDKLINP